MSPREIIAQAWAITTTQRVLWRWGFLASFCETLLALKFLLYQAYFYWKLTQGETAGFFDFEKKLLEVLPIWLFVVLMFGFALLVVAEYFLPHICTGAIIGLGAKVHRGEEPKGGLVLGLYNFFPMFAAKELFLLSGWVTLLTIISTTIRYIDGPMRTAIIGLAVFLFLLSNSLKFLASFAEEAIVTRKLSLFDAIGKSFKLIVSYLGHIVFLMLLLLVISIRIVINTLMVVLIPAIVVGLAVVLSTFLSDTVSYIVSGTVGVLLVVLASYMFAYLSVFKQTVWTLTYLELSDKRDLDVIFHDSAEVEAAEEPPADVEAVPAH